MDGAESVWQLCKSALRHISHFGPQEWLLTLIAVVIIGALCMRGFGSRSSY